MSATGCSLVTGGVYRGDGTSCAKADSNSDGHDDACDDIIVIPAVTDWGVIVLTLLTLATGALVLSRREGAEDLPVTVFDSTRP